MKLTLFAAEACALLIVSACAGPMPQPSVTPLNAVSAVAPAPKPLSAESLTVEFGSGQSVLSQVALTQLDGAARLYRDAQPEVMIVVGHSDKIGPEFPNLLLSARRAETVKRALVDRGVPAARLQLIAYGQAEPIPPVTASRAVVVTWR